MTPASVNRLELEVAVLHSHLLSPVSTATHNPRPPKQRVARIAMEHLEDRSSLSPHGAWIPMKVPSTNGIHPRPVCTPVPSRVPDLVAIRAGQGLSLCLALQSVNPQRALPHPHMRGALSSGHRRSAELPASARLQPGCAAFAELILRVLRPLPDANCFH